MRSWLGGLLKARERLAPEDAQSSLEPDFANEHGFPDFAASTSPAPLDGVPWALRRIRAQNDPDFEQLVDFILANPVYRLQVQQRKPDRSDAVSLLAELPAGARANQKYVWGIWYRGKLVGCLEIIRSWPEVDKLYIGFLMIDERWRRHGLASAALKLLAERTRSWAGIRRWRLAVVETQQDAQEFWKQQGFLATGQLEKRPQYRGRLVVMEKPIGR